MPRDEWGCPPRSLSFIQTEGCSTFYNVGSTFDKAYERRQKSGTFGKAQRWHTNPAGKSSALSDSPGPGAYQPYREPARPSSTKGTLGPAAEHDKLWLDYTDAGSKQLLETLDATEKGAKHQQPATPRSKRLNWLDFGAGTLTASVDFVRPPSLFDAAARPGRVRTSSFGTMKRFKERTKDVIEDPGPGQYQVATDRKGGGTWDSPSVRPWSARPGYGKRGGGGDGGCGIRLDFGPFTPSPASNQYDVVAATSIFSGAESVRNGPSSTFGTGGRFGRKDNASDREIPGPGYYSCNVGAVTGTPRTTTFGPWGHNYPFRRLKSAPKP